MGSRSKKDNNVLIDFATGESLIDGISELRKIQDNLYRLDNPYVGNKRGILVDIADALDKNSVKFDKVLDLFSGSGVVSTFFKLMGKTVISNDLLTSSYYNSVAFSENNHIQLSREESDWLCTNENKDKGDFILKNYTKRFTVAESIFLDNYRANIDTLIERKFSKNLDDKKVQREALVMRAVCILSIEHYVLNRCFLGGRLNKGQVLADLDHRMAHDRNGGDSMQFTIDPLPLFSYHEEKGCRAYNLDALDAAKQVREDFSDTQLAYVDPPYGQSQSDYATMFSFCEEYVYGEKIDNLPHILAASKKFASKKNYKEHFREVLNEINWIPIWAVSFNAASFEAAEGIVEILKDFKKEVTTVSINHEYRYRKERGSAVEYLFIAR